MPSHHRAWISRSTAPSYLEDDTDLRNESGLVDPAASFAHTHQIRAEMSQSRCSVSGLTRPRYANDLCKSLMPWQHSRIRILRMYIRPASIYAMKIRFPGLQWNWFWVQKRLLNMRKKTCLIKTHGLICLSMSAKRSEQRTNPGCFILI